VVLASILKNLLRALTSIVAVKGVVFPTISLALFHLNVAPQTREAFRTDAVHQILVAAEILQYGF